jgi:hypothetical protein
MSTKQEIIAAPREKQLLLPDLVQSALARNITAGAASFSGTNGALITIAPQIDRP